MIMVRQVLHAQAGKAGELVALFKQVQAQGLRGPATRMRVLTNVSGPNDTVVIEVVVESIDAYQRQMAEMFANPAAQAGMAPIQGLIASGHREFYTIELES